MATSSKFSSLQNLPFQDKNFKQARREKNRLFKTLQQRKPGTNDHNVDGDEDEDKDEDEDEEYDQASQTSAAGSSTVSHQDFNQLKAQVQDLATNVQLLCKKLGENAWPRKPARPEGTQQALADILAQAKKKRKPRRKRRESKFPSSEGDSVSLANLLKTRLAARVPDGARDSSDESDDDRQIRSSSGVSSLYDPLARTMLSRVLAHHPSVEAWVRSEPWKDQRNKHEAMSLARALDFFIEDFGEVCFETRGTETLVRRLAGLRYRDANNSIACLEALQLAPPDSMLPKHLELALFKEVKKLQAFRNRRPKPIPTTQNKKTDKPTKTTTKKPSGAGSPGGSG